MPKTCHATKCSTYIGDSQEFCRRHWAMIPWPQQRALRLAAEARQHGEDGSDLLLTKAILDAADAISNKERESALRSHPSTKSTPSIQSTPTAR